MALLLRADGQVEMSLRVGAVIVTYNSRECVGRAIDSCLREGLKVVVIDNDSKDGTPDAVASHPQVDLVRNTENRGFAAAVNEGFRRLDTECVLLLNPDAELTTSVVAMERELRDVAAVGGSLVGSDGEPQIGFTIRRFPTAAVLALEALGINRIWRGNPVNRKYRGLDLDLNFPADVDQPAGAFLMVRRDAWERIGGFDERFFPVWFEDVDFCLRLKSAGYRIRYTPESVALHEGGHSIGRISDDSRQLYWYGSLLKYVAKHFETGGKRVVCAAIVLGGVMRMIAAVLLERKVHPVVVYAKVVRLAVRLF